MTVATTRVFNSGLWYEPVKRGQRLPANNPIYGQASGFLKVAYRGEGFNAENSIRHRCLILGRARKVSADRQKR
jgi:hypothetical protein